MKEWEEKQRQTTGAPPRTLTGAPEVRRRITGKRKPEVQAEPTQEELDQREKQHIKRKKEWAQEDDEEETLGRLRDDEFQQLFIARVEKTGPPWHDANTGLELPPEEVEKGMQAERDSFRKFSVYDASTWDAFRKAKEDGLDPILVRAGWVLIQRADAVKARLVGQELSDGGHPDELYCPTPRHVAHRLVLAQALRRKWPVRVGDVKTAFLHAMLEGRPVFVIPPPTEEGTEDKNFLWRLNRALYGLRASPKRFSEFFAKAVSKTGWRRLPGEPQLYYNRKYSGAVLAVHTDDILFTADGAIVDRIQEELSKEMTIKWKGQLDSTWKRFLGLEWRRCVDDSSQCRVPEKYCQGLLTEWRLERCKASWTPFCPVSKKELDEDWPIVNQQAHARYRRTVGQLMWMINARPDLAYCFKELARRCSKPTQWDEHRIKRCLKYVKRTLHDVLEVRIDRECTPEKLTIVTDSSWASAVDRRSTSGGAIFWCGILLHSWSKTQPTVAMSSCEAEVIAMTLAVQEGRYLQQVLEEILEKKISLEAHSDASSAISFARRRGTGRMRHIDIKEMWLQEQVHEHGLCLKKVASQENVADIFTKNFDTNRFEYLRQMIGMKSQEEDGQQTLSMMEEGFEVVEPRCPRCQLPLQCSRCTARGSLQRSQEREQSYIPRPKERAAAVFGRPTSGYGRQTAEQQLESLRMEMQMELVTRLKQVIQMLLQTGHSTDEVVYLLMQ